MSDMPAALADLVTWLAAHGFREAGSESSGGFGDRYLVLSGDELAVRILSDRGQWFVDISRPGRTDWYGVELWRVCLHGDGGPVEPMSPDEQAEFVRAEFDSLAEAVRTRYREIRSCMRTVQKARSREVFGDDD
jgi:hypothetical protein